MQSSYKIRILTKDQGFKTVYLNKGDDLKKFEEDLEKKYTRFVQLSATEIVKN